MKYVITVIVCLLQTMLYAQYEAANWYFGENAGINFNANTGVVTPLLNGKLNTKEGASSISDADGNLLFYTDGITVYNKNHDIMENGTGLYGNPSSTQSAIVVPKPKNPNIFYIFTVGTGASGSTNNGFNYSEVDISENGGLGKVTLKNQNLLAYCSEKISAVVKDCNTQSIWIITLSTSTSLNERTGLNTFYAYEITETQINSTPVKSTILSTTNDPRGALKLSPNGLKLVSANMDGGLFLYDFNANTGEISNQQQITIKNTTSSKAYGVEFSPDNRFLYVHATNDYNGPGSNDASKHLSALIQYDLEASNILDSQIILDNRNLYRGALQLGPDGKIYRALSASFDNGLPYLGVIENPNALGTASKYRHNAVDLNGKNSTQGLPPFIQSFFNQKIDIIHAEDGVTTNNLPLCIGDTYTLEAEEHANADYHWTFNGETLTNQPQPWLMEITDAGLYKVIITPYGATVCDLIEGEAYVTFHDIPVANSTSGITTICDVGNDGVETIDLTINEAEILGNQSDEDYNITYFETLVDAQSDINQITTPSTYQNLFEEQDIYARVENSDNTNCYDITTFSIKLIPTPGLETENISQHDIYSPYNDGLTFFNLFDAVISTDADVLFYDINPETSATLPITSPNSFANTIENQIIYVRATNNKTGCYTDQSFSLITIDAETTIETAYYCTGSEVNLNAGISTTEINNYFYQWLLNDVVIPGATNYDYSVIPNGIYSVIITDKSTNFVQIKTYNLEESSSAIITDIKVEDLNTINTVTISVKGLGIYEYALYKDDAQYTAYQSSNYFTNVYPGHYIVKVKDLKNNCGITEANVDVLGFPKFFTPNGDGYHDTWKIENESQALVLSSTILIFNRNGRLIKELRTTEEGWDGTQNGTLMPSDDYWFTLTLEDGRTFKSHFTLKR